MSAVSLAHAQSPFVLVLDIGTSSLRALVHDANARDVENFAARRFYQPKVSEDGGSTLDASVMFDAFASALDEIVHECELTHGRVEIAAVAASSLASNILAVDANGEPLTPAYLYADTRNARSVEQVRAAYDWNPIYARTGCPLHTAYLPARFLWLRETQPEIYSRAVRFVSLHEYFLQTVFGRAGVSLSFAAWTGLLNHATCDWDDEALQIAQISRAQLSPVCSATEAFRGLRGEFATRWKSLGQIPWYPALGDGASANVGSGCVDETRAAVTIGTSGALRVVTDAQRGLEKLPHGLWMYRVDGGAGLIGGSLTDGGSILDYFARVLKISKRKEMEREVAQIPPDSHGLTMLPFFAGERSPGYHGGARATLSGWNLDTSPAELWRAAMEAVAYRFAAIYDLLCTAIAPPREIIASGGALLHSPVWMQILADVFHVPVIASGEEEATARGTAVLALRTLGIISSLDQLPALRAETFLPRAEYFGIYQRARERQKLLYDSVLESSK